MKTWYFYLLLYFVFYIIFTQFYKILAEKSSNDGALTILLQITGGILIMYFIPFFSFKLPSNIITYLFLILSCVCYAIADRVNTTARKGLDVSIFSILHQLVTVFMVAWGIIFFKESILYKQIFGILLILIGNILVLYNGDNIKINKYIIYSLIGSISMSLGMIVDVGISYQFNLPLYISITLLLPSFLILIFDKLSIKDIIKEFKKVNKKILLVVGFSWPLYIYFLLRIYQENSVIMIAPLISLTTLLNVIISCLIFKDKNNILKKIISAIIVVIGIILIKC